MKDEDEDHSHRLSWLIFTRSRSEAVGSSSIRGPIIRGVFVRIYGVSRS